MSKQQPRPLRVLHCPWNLAGQQAGLAAAERRLGLDSRNVVLFDSQSGFPSDEPLAKRGRRLQTELARFRLLWRAMVWADVVHFAFGQSILGALPNATTMRTKSRGLSPIFGLYTRLLRYRDLPLLSAMGKSLFVTWQGDDARQADRSRELFDISIAHEVDAAYYPPGSDHVKRHAIKCMARYATGHYALNPDLMHVLPPATRFLPYASFPPASVVPRYLDLDEKRPIRIAHAPSHRGAKGTRHIIDAIDELRRQGVAFEFVLIEGVSRSEVLARLATADVVVDQLLAGWYGGLGVEAMALGKVLVAYIRNDDLKYVPAAQAAELPVINADPETITAVLRDLLSAPRPVLRAAAEKSRAYVEKYHAPDYAARITSADYYAARQYRTNRS